MPLIAVTSPFWRAVLVLSLLAAWGCGTMSDKAGRSEQASKTTDEVQIQPKVQMRKTETHATRAAPPRVPSGAEARVENNERRRQARAESGAEQHQAPGPAMEKQSPELVVDSANSGNKADSPPLRARKKGAKAARPGPPLEPGSTAATKEEPSGLHWNAWTDEEGAPFSPVPLLHPHRDYRLNLDLATIAYRNNDAAVASRSISGSLESQIEDWLKKNPDRESATLKVLLLPDPVFFESVESGPEGRVKPLSIDLKTARRGSSTTSADPFAAFKDSAKPDFFLGRATFPLHPIKPGLAGVGISFWVDGRPVDELSLSLCVAEGDSSTACQGTRAANFSLEGFDSLRLGSETATAHQPDAALHFLQLESERVIGVFRRKSWPEGEFKTWPLGKQTGELADYFEKTMIPAFGKAVNDAQLAQRGSELYNLLFPDDSREGKEARAAFEKMFADSRAGAPPSLFVRMLPQSSRSMLLLPLGLIAVKPDNGPQEFAGFRFRIETPLSIQNYQPESACISSWAVVMPSDSGDLKEVRNSVTKHLPALREQAQYFYDRMSEFGTGYIGQGEEETPTALLVTSHHDRNQLSFDSQDILTSAAVRRQFKKPSVAILNGCGTGGAGAVDFIRQLNSRGVAAVIATSAEIRSAIAADFLNSLFDVIQQNKSKADFTLSQAYFETLQSLSDKDQDGVKYGPFALTYALMGNGNLRICQPARRAP